MKYSFGSSVSASNHEIQHKSVATAAKLRLMQMITRQRFTMQISKSDSEAVRAVLLLPLLLFFLSCASLRRLNGSVFGDVESKK